MSSAQGAKGQKIKQKMCCTTAECCVLQAEGSSRACSSSASSAGSSTMQGGASTSSTAAHHMIRGLSIKLSQAPVTVISVIAISVFAGHGDGGEANK